jgi:hypothetical protein
MSAWTPSSIVSTPNRNSSRSDGWLSLAAASWLFRHRTAA